MKQISRILKKTAGIILCAAILAPSSPAPALAGIISAASAGKAVVPGGGAGAAIGAVNASSRLGGIAVNSDLSLQSTLPGVVNPAFANVELTPGLQFVATVNGQTVIPAAKDISAVAAKPAYSPAAVTAGAGEAAAAESRPLRRVFSAIGKALHLGKSSQMFDGARSRRGGVGILPDDSRAGGGIELDQQPQQPENTETPRLSWNRVHFPGRTAQPTGLGRLFRGSSIKPVALPGNPQDAAGVERALRQLIGENTRDFGGVSPAQLETVIANKAAGRASLPATIYVNFRQRHESLPVDGTYLDFTVKLINGQAVLVGSTAQLYPRLALDAFGRLSDEEIRERAFDRLGRPTGSHDDLNNIGRRIMHLGGRWRSVYLMMSKSETLMAAVDVNSGETFAWDPRMNADVGGRATGRGVDFDPEETGTRLDTMPMAHAEVTTSDGRRFYTDGDGYFTLDGVASDAPVTVTARLRGRYATVRDQGRKDLVVTAVAKPGETIQLVFNPQGVEENAIAQVNAYRHVTKVHDWLAAQGIDAAISRSIPVNPNMDRDCNAYYTPWSPSLNFFSSSKRCINTAFDTVIYHEYGHFVDDMLGGIVNGALSEGWGDILSMYITGQPVLGKGFLRERDPSYIRHGENTYQFNARDEVHAQGQAWMGFGWKLRQELIASFRKAGLTEAEARQKGAALSEALVIPVLFANVRSIPAAIEAVLMRDVGENGQAAHFAEIQKAAAAHGIKVEAPRPGELVSPQAARRLGFLAWLSVMAERLSRIVSG
ncbi:MAG: hypothetical protein ABIJ96_16945 [Elusimicrobiota bacterium]